MSHLLDTNVVSELRKSAHRANAAVIAWAETQDAGQLFLSTITVLELEIGVARRERRDAVQGRALRRWLEDSVLPNFSGRILPVSLAVARAAAPMHVPDPRPERDTLIAATALVHGLTVVTRNEQHFTHLGISVLNPWSG